MDSSMLATLRANWMRDTGTSRYIDGYQYSKAYIDICQYLGGDHGKPNCPWWTSGVAALTVWAGPLTGEVAEQLAGVLKAVADPARLQLLALIRTAGSACACDLTEPVGLSQPTVSHHLKVLAKAGLVHREQRGQWAWFRVDEERMRSLAGLFA